MAKTRKVKEAKDLVTNELIYFTGHAKATYMSDGSTVEDDIITIKDTVNNIKHLIEVTYSELKSLRDNSELIPGSYYRITDYETIITSLTATSAGHKFDIILLALNENTLSEEAEICNHSFPQYTQNSLGVFIDYSNDFYYIAENWKNWSYDNLPDGIKSLISTNTPVKRQLFNKSFKAGELRIKVTARCHRNTSKNQNYTYKIPCLGIDICDSNINENDPSTWNDHIVSSDYHKYTASISGNVDNNDNRPENTEVEYVLNIPADGTYTVCIAVDDTDDILMNSSNQLRSELGVYGEIFEPLETDYFENIPVDAWDVKYCLDNDNTRFNWADTNTGKGVIYYMKDEHDNECYYDFKNILFNGYYTFSYIINGNIYDGTVKYKTCHANKMPAAHNDLGIRILNNNVFKNTSASSYCVSNIFEQDCKNNTFGDNCVSNKFGNYCENNTFGSKCQYNTFEDYCVSNKFGDFCQSNTFGVYCQSNNFGSYIIRCTFGNQCINNKFTNGSGTNLEACRMIELGEQCNSVNICTTEGPSYSSGKWLQNIYIANAMSGSIVVNNINGTRTKYVTKNADGGVISYFESELFENTENIISTTYSSLKTLRDQSKLIPGCKYRITDFITTTNGKEYSSAVSNQQFDIVVEALTENKLNEDAKVLHHNGDTYFANNALTTWNIKYILDNDENRFNWATSTGKGVIYYMKDEYGNECSYDFKNIKFNGKYTFSYTVNGTLYDGSIKYGKLCYNNFVCGDLLSYSSYKGLPKVYFNNTSDSAKCYNNVILENCWDIIFETNCYNNHINSECETLRIGNNCHSNTFGVFCKSVNFGSDRNNIVVDKDNNGNIIQYQESEVLNKQNKLVSGENIVTVNGNSILISGNIIAGDISFEYTDIELDDPEYIDYSKEYLTIQSLEDNNEVSFSVNAIMYQPEGSNTWSTLNTDEKLVLNTNQEVKFKINNPTITPYGIGTFSASKRYNVKGNMMSLLYGDDFIGKTDLTEIAQTISEPVRYKLFIGSNTLIDASNLILPATTLADGCYEYMFSGCSKLTTAPELPATTLADGCYWNMFYDCKALTTAPDLPATTLAEYCYAYMFSGCSKLNYIKMLAMDINASGSLSDWVNGVSSTGTFVKNKNATWRVTGVNGIPSGWTVETV